MMDIALEYAVMSDIYDIRMGYAPEPANEGFGKKGLFRKKTDITDVIIQIFTRLAAIFGGIIVLYTQFKDMLQSGKDFQLGFKRDAKRRAQEKAKAPQNYLNSEILNAIRSTSDYRTISKIVDDVSGYLQDTCKHADIIKGHINDRIFQTSKNVGVRVATDEIRTPNAAIVGRKTTRSADLSKGNAFLSNLASSHELDKEEEVNDARNGLLEKVRDEINFLDEKNKEALKDKIVDEKKVLASALASDTVIGTKVINSAKATTEKLKVVKNTMLRYKNMSNKQIKARQDKKQKLDETPEDLRRLVEYINTILIDGSKTYKAIVGDVKEVQSMQKLGESKEAKGKVISAESKIISKGNN